MTPRHVPRGESLRLHGHAPPALGVNCRGVRGIQNDHFASRWQHAPHVPGRDPSSADVERPTLWQRFVGWFWYRLRDLL